MSNHDDEPEYGPSIDGIAEGKEDALARLCATAICRLFELFDGAAKPSDRERYSREMRLWTAQRIALDAHEGAVKVSQMEEYLQRILAAEARIRGDKPAKAPPPQGEGSMGGVH